MARGHSFAVLKERSVGDGRLDRNKQSIESSMFDFQSVDPLASDR